MKSIVFAYHNMGIVGLEALVRNGYDVIAVFTHEDDPGENCWFDSVKKWAQEKGIKVYTTEEINSSPWIEKTAAMKPDVIFSFYYRKMICREILGLPWVGAFNLHGSLLPAYRGRCPVNWALINGETRTGVTLHYMIEKPDAGDIVGQKAVWIEQTDTAKILYDKLCLAAKDLLDEVLPWIKQNRIPRKKQDLQQGSYYGGRRPEDGCIHWDRSADEIYNLVRGVTKPYPGAFAFDDHHRKIIIWWAAPVALKESSIPGTVIVRDPEVLVQTGHDAIRLLEMETDGQSYCGEQIRTYFIEQKVRILK